jgi:hypothetical protein
LFFVRLLLSNVFTRTRNTAATPPTYKSDRHGRPPINEREPDDGDSDYFDSSLTNEERFDLSLSGNDADHIVIEGNYMQQKQAARKLANAKYKNLKQFVEANLDVLGLADVAAKGNPTPWAPANFQGNESKPSATTRRLSFQCSLHRLLTYRCVSCF